MTSRSEKDFANEMIEVMAEDKSNHFELSTWQCGPDPKTRGPTSADVGIFSSMVYRASHGKKRLRSVEILDRAKRIFNCMKAIFWPSPNGTTGDMQACAPLYARYRAQPPPRPGLHEILAGANQAQANRAWACGLHRTSACLIGCCQKDSRDTTCA